jgi:hypothetical protein
VNRGFGERHPEMVAAIVKSLLEGNRPVREQLDVVGRAFGWTRDKTKQELTKVHLNLSNGLASSGRAPLGRHPKPAIDGHLKTGQRS